MGKEYPERRIAEESHAQLNLLSRKRLIPIVTIALDYDDPTEEVSLLWWETLPTDAYRRLLEAEIERLNQKG